MPRSALINVMVQAARKAGRVLSRDFGEIEQLRLSARGPEEFARASYRKASEILVKSLGEARPGYGFLVGEKGFIDGSDRSHRWIIDPLSGKNNFSHVLPFFAISIALEREGQCIAGLIYNPALNETFVAEKGKGVFLIDKRLRVATYSRLDQAVVLCDLFRRSSPASLHGDSADMASIALAGTSVRSIGSTALSLAFVSVGRADGYFTSSSQLCDRAAGILLVRESGGFVEKNLSTSQSSTEHPGLIAGNEAIKNALVALLWS